MNKTSDILAKQYIKLCSERDLLTKECEDLPVGSIQQKRIKNGVYFYRQYREGTMVKTVFVPGDQLAEVNRSIKRRKEIEKRLKEINTEISQLIKALGPDIHNMPNFRDYKPVKNVDYKDYTMYMSHLAHEVKRLGKEEFVVEYSGVRESGVRARYLKALISYLTQNGNTKAYPSANIVLDPLTYQMYFTYGKKDILNMRIKNAVPEFLMQGLLITNIQEAVGGTLS
ncbi:MAG: hypothetical protein MJZ11_07595 [Lachnospiraceae bacterium]|nr:hypothetical protein [Lachnospiraceae bacterium]